MERIEAISGVGMGYEIPSSPRKLFEEAKAAKTVSHELFQKKNKVKEKNNKEIAKLREYRKELVSELNEIDAILPSAKDEREDLIEKKKKTLEEVRLLKYEDERLVNEIRKVGAEHRDALDRANRLFEKYLLEMSKGAKEFDELGELKIRLQTMKDKLIKDIGYITGKDDADEELIGDREARLEKIEAAIVSLERR
jgi:hypothetical protein